MAQELTVKVTNPDGTSSMKKIYVIRAWQESSGKQIFLFANGVYGYKDESPVRSESEFDAIHNKQQKQAAIFWWKKTGAEYSARFYAEQEAKAAEKAGVYQFELQGSESDLDSILYVRKSAKKGKGAVSDPHPWMKWFSKRPEWWGQATVITFADFTYELIKPDDETTGPQTATAQPEEKPDESGRGSMAMPENKIRPDTGEFASF